MLTLDYANGLLHRSSRSGSVAMPSFAASAFSRSPAAITTVKL
ncbi:MAG: hypothetical protein ACK46L_01145 [Synechococcaceae cyanobacterium]